MWFDLEDGLEIGYFVMLFLSPLLVGAISIVMEKTMLKRLYHLDHLYGLLLTFGCALVIEGVFRHWYGVLGDSYPSARDFWMVGCASLAIPALLPPLGGRTGALGLFWYLVLHRADQVGLFAARRNREPKLLQAFGVNVPLIITLTYGAGCALAAFAGVLLRRFIR